VPTLEIACPKIWQYQLFSSDNDVIIMFNNERLRQTMPPVNDSNYVYGWRQEGDRKRVDPLLDDGLLMHLFTHPNGTIYRGDERRNRLPKRKAALVYSDGFFAIGWGIQWIECFNWEFLLHCESLIFFGSLLYIILYSCLSKDQNRVSVGFGGEVLYVVEVNLYIC
jgi:hypothetical protein